MDQLAAMFCQLGKATAQMVRESTHTANKDEEVLTVGVQENANTKWREIESAVALELV